MIRKRRVAYLGKRARRTIASTAAFYVFFCQNLAWSVCADGTTFPAGGFIGGQPPAVNWTPNIFSGAGGSIFVPDNSVFEHNDPAQPLTGGGHNWVFDQGTTACKVTDIGAVGETPTAWAIPPAGCLFLPVIKSGRTVSLDDVPNQGEAITPTCDPELLSKPGAPNPANTKLNHLGCAISHGVATTAQSATTFLFVAGIKGGLFAVPLVNVTNPVIGGEAGKIVFSPTSHYSDIPAGQKLTNTTVSPNGMFVIATSSRRQRFIYACLNPLGDPGDPSRPNEPNFSVPPASEVKCMQVGNNNLAADLTTVFGPDNQPYFGGQRAVNSFNGEPGGSSATAWPQCIFNSFGFADPAPTTLMGKLAAVFDAHSANRCGNAASNLTFSQAQITQPQAIIRHGPYMYAARMGGTVVQFKTTVDPVSGLSQYSHRTYVIGLAPVRDAVTTGLGVADDLQSLLVFTDPSGVGAALQEVVTKLPLCEDM